MSLKVQIEVILPNHWHGGVEYKKGEVVVVTPARAGNLIDKGIGKKAGVVDDSPPKKSKSKSKWKAKETEVHDEEVVAEEDEDGLYAD